ncbi:MAG: ABC transporter permease, partial [Alphaproteobacteria bacterium]|nr:ABC transporter permease [Alphaproteobacteria bacterium]
MPELLRRLVRSPQGALGLAIVALIVLLAVCGPWLAPYGPDTMAPRLRYRSPS